MQPEKDYLKVIDSFISYVEEANDCFVCDESVEKFAEKLKALRRLLAKGFKFCGWQDDLENGYNTDYILFDLDRKVWDASVCEDLDLLFGEKEG